MIVETSSQTKDGKSITLSTRTDVNKVPFNEGKYVISMCSLKAPVDPNKRASIDIICVIDRSSSMEGEKLRLMIKTLTFAVDELGENDSMALVTYDSQVQVAFELMKMTDSNKFKAKKIIDSLTAGSTTNLSGGLLMGLDIATKRPLPRNEVCSILLFTDGLANVGITALETIVLATQRKLSMTTSPCTLFTFGFGEDHDPNMMQSIATSGNGMYYYLQTEDQIPVSFASCIGGLQSVFAQNLQLVLQVTTPDVKITQVLNSKYRSKVKETFPNNKIIIPLGDIYMEERRDILVEFFIPPCETKTNESICQVNLEYFNVLNTFDETASSEIFLERSEPTDLPPAYDDEIEKQKHRLVVADALEKGHQLAEKQKFEEAKNVITEAKKALKVRFADEDYKTLVDDLEEAGEFVTSQEIFTPNKMKMYTKSASHQYQRNVETSERVTAYETTTKLSKKKEWINKMK